jgi:hypothetical protein
MRFASGKVYNKHNGFSGISARQKCRKKSVTPENAFANFVQSNLSA